MNIVLNLDYDEACQLRGRLELNMSDPVGKALAVDLIAALGNAIEEEDERRSRLALRCADCGRDSGYHAAACQAHRQMPARDTPCRAGCTCKAGYNDPHADYCKGAADSQIPRPHYTPETSL